MTQPKQDDPHFRLRIPAAVKDAIADAAATNKRSINAEIVARLEQSLSGESLPAIVKQAVLEALSESKAKVWPS